MSSLEVPNLSAEELKLAQDYSQVEADFWEGKLRAGAGEDQIGGVKNRIISEFCKLHGVENGHFTNNFWLLFGNGSKSAQLAKQMLDDPTMTDDAKRTAQKILERPEEKSVDWLKLREPELVEEAVGSIALRNAFYDSEAADDVIRSASQLRMEVVLNKCLQELVPYSEEHGFAVKELGR
jgi:hypothetical protein